MYTPEQIGNYLARIGLAWDPSRKPDADFLRELQYAHWMAVPYENLDIVKGIPLRLDPDSLYDKIVTRHRGGYCFELNGAFGTLLRSVGWEVTDCFARFLQGAEGIPKRRHRVLRVVCGGEVFLCDVGVGLEAPRIPLLLRTDPEQSDGTETYRFEKDGFLGWILCRKKEGEWKRVFSFTEEPQLPQDFETTSFWCERHPDSPFTQKLSLSLKTPRGRKTVDGNLFRVFSGGAVTETEIPPERLESLLKEEFGIVY